MQAVCWGGPGGGGVCWLGGGSHGSTAAAAGTASGSSRRLVWFALQHIKLLQLFLAHLIKNTGTSSGRVEKTVAREERLTIMTDHAWSK